MGFRCTYNFIPFLERCAIREGCLAYHILGLFELKAANLSLSRKPHILLQQQKTF